MENIGALQESLTAGNRDSKIFFQRSQIFTFFLFHVYLASLLGTTPLDCSPSLVQSTWATMTCWLLDDAFTGFRFNTSTVQAYNDSGTFT